MKIILLLNLILLLLCQSLYVVGGKEQKTYYDVLEIKNDATLEQIKKAYRRLALKYHPDRNKGNEEESSELFREVGHAYEVLSNENTRSDYGRSLRYGHQYSPHQDNTWGSNRQQRQWHGRNPFDQFNDLFRNDPFFREGFKGMDELFNKLFQNDNDGNGNNNAGEEKVANKQGIFGNVMDNFGFKFSSSFSSSSGGGTHSSTTYRTSSSGNSRSFYSSRSTRTVIENGQRVTIQSLEKDGNKIEEKYVDNKLIERKINGVLDLDGDNQHFFKIPGKLKSSTS